MRKKKGIIPKIASFFLAFSMLLGVVAGTSVISEGATHPDAVTKIEAQLQDGSGPIYEIGQYQVFHLKASFALPNGAVKKDDTTTIKLPNELIFNQTSDIKIKDGAGNIIANAVFNLHNKTLKLTYTDYAESHSDIKGIFYFFVRMDRDVVDGEMHIPLIFDVDGKPLDGGSVHFPGYPNHVSSHLAKTGWQDANDDNKKLYYQLKLNSK